MTRDELFPRERFPIRKRTTFQIGKKKITITVELYFERNDESLGGWVGEYVCAASMNDAAIRFASATIMPPDSDKIHYIEKNGQFRKVSPRKLAARVTAFEHTFHETNGVNPGDEEMGDLLDLALAVAQWEYF